MKASVASRMLALARAGSALLLAVAMLSGCDSPRGFARTASLDVCAQLDPASVTALLGRPVRLEPEPMVVGNGMAGSCRVVSEKGEALLAIAVATDASLNAAGIRSHVSGIFDRKLELELEERNASGSPVERRELSPEHGKAIQLVPTSAARSPSGLFLGVDRGVMVSVVHTGQPPAGLGEFGIDVMNRLRGGPRLSQDE